jgi:putative phosphoesterase
VRIAIISDIHGNLVALEAALADIAGQGVDQIVCLGDVAMDGPQPREVIARLRALGCPVVLGNADAWLLDPPAVDTTKEGDAARWEAIYQWSAAQVTEEDKAFLRSFQPTISLSLGEGKTLLCFHGTPRSYDEIIKATTPDEELDQVFAGVEADVLAGGHTHSQLFRRWRGALLLNPGSVGLPFDANPPDEGPFPGIHNPAWAEYILLTRDGRQLSVDLRRVPYGVDDLRQTVLACGMPHAEWFAGDWVAG